MAADLAVGTNGLGHARLAAAVAFVPRATIAELVGRTVDELRRDGSALGIPAARRPVKRRVPKAAATRKRRLGPSTRRPSARPRRTGGGAAPVEPTNAAPIDRLAVGRAMERFIASRIAAYEAAGGDDPEPEKTARTIGHYARALGLVRGYLSDIEKDAETHDEAPTRSLSDLRDELRRHLERIWDEDQDAGGLGGAGDDAR